MENRKNTGAYYTPKVLSDFLVSHVFKNFIRSKNISILEPSCGDGQFIESLVNNIDLDSFDSIKIRIVDINDDELNKAANDIPNKIILDKVHGDYLKFSLKDESLYSLIIGNPPYIKKNNLQDTQIIVCEEVHHKMKLFNSKSNSTATIKNIWPSFIEANIMNLDDEGVLCLVIPSEVLQVKYASELREIITDEFDRVEIFTFRELIFQGVQQDVVAIIGVKNITDISKHGFSFYHVENINDLKKPFFIETNNNINRSESDKWTNYILNDADLNFIYNLKVQYSSIKEYCKNSEVGIVTAANNFFIVNDSIIKENKLGKSKEIIKPIISKGSLIPPLLKFEKVDYLNIKQQNKRASLLHFPNLEKTKLTKAINDYLKIGEKEQLNERYKMTIRQNWYHVPSVWKSEGLFVKRTHIFPKMIINNASVYATDSFYRVNTKDEFDISKLSFSFYNSLTFVLAELEGRYYGGGVLELTPNEFKNLKIPYKKSITDLQITQLDNLLRSKEKIEVILEFTNSILLEGVDFSRLEVIRKKLLNRRLKKDSKSLVISKSSELKHIKEEQLD